jgi:heme-degrading monooxygenase HmoA
MAVIMEQVMPEGASLQMLDLVTDEMNVDEQPPEGLLFHTHFEQDGQVRIVDVWESEEALEQFRETRLMPAIQAVAQRQGIEQPPQPDTTITPVHRLVRGR